MTPSAYSNWDGRNQVCESVGRWNFLDLEIRRDKRVRQAYRIHGSADQYHEIAAPTQNAIGRQYHKERTKSMDEIKLKSASSIHSSLRTYSFSVTTRKGKSQIKSIKAAFSFESKRFRSSVQTDVAPYPQNSWALLELFWIQDGRCKHDSRQPLQDVHGKVSLLVSHGK